MVEWTPWAIHKPMRYKKTCHSATCRNNHIQEVQTHASMPSNRQTSIFRCSMRQYHSTHCNSWDYDLKLVLQQSCDITLQPWGVAQQLWDVTQQLWDSHKTPWDVEEALWLSHCLVARSAVLQYLWLGHHFFPGLFFSNPIKPRKPAPQAPNPINWKPQTPKTKSKTPTPKPPLMSKIEKKV